MSIDLTPEQKAEIVKSLGFLNLTPEQRDILTSIGFGLAILGSIIGLIGTFDEILDRIRRELSK